jgi:hypothetical protein
LKFETLEIEGDSVDERVFVHEVFDRDVISFRSVVHTPMQHLNLP